MLSQKVQISGINTHKLPRLNNAKIRELFERKDSGDTAAREELVRGNLRLVLSILQRFKNRGESIEDLFQVGCIGLLKAVDNFKREEDVQFSTYAVPMIIGEIKRYLRDNNSVHISRSLKQLSQRVQQEREKLTKELMREPTLKELAYVLGINAEEVILAFNASYEPVSLHEPVYQDSTDPVFVMDILGDPANNPEAWVENLALKEAMEGLSPRERRILEARFFEGKTQMEIAAAIGISQAQVSRIEKAALGAIRGFFQQGNQGWKEAPEDHE